MLGWIVGVIAVFTLWLILTLIVFYVENIIVYPFPTAEIIGVVNIVLGIAAYIGIFLAAWKVYPGGRKSVRLVSVLPLLLLYLYYLAGAFIVPDLLPSSGFERSLAAFLSVVCAAVFLAYHGVVLQKGGRLVQQETVRFFLEWMGRITFVFAPVSVIVAIAGWVGGVNTRITVPLNYIYFFTWNVVAVIALVRYMVRPSAFVEEGAVSEAFIKEYRISPREADIITYLSRGLSNKEIADTLNISFTTVRTHVYNIFKKTGAGNRVDLLRIISGYRE